MKRAFATDRQNAYQKEFKKFLTEYNPIMKTQEIFIAHPQTSEQVSALKAVMQILKIKFEVKKEKNYNPEFVKKIMESREQAKNGKVTRVNKENLKEFLGI